MGNEQSAEGFSSDPPCTQPSSPSHNPNPKALTPKQRRRSARSSRYQGNFTASPSLSFLSTQDESGSKNENEDDSEPELGSKIGEVKQESVGSVLESEVKKDVDEDNKSKMTEKRTRPRKATSVSEPKAKKPKVTVETENGDAGWGGCECSDGLAHSSPAECEEAKKEWGAARTE
jgi:hypothetical protein